MVLLGNIATRRQALDGLRTILPEGWSVDPPPKPRAKGATVDGVLQLRAPDGQRVRLRLEYKARLDPIDVDTLKRSSEPSLVVAPFLSPKTRERLVDAGLNYVDATGNIRIALRSPAVFILCSGADTNPFRGPEQTRTLKGPTAMRILRTLCDYRPPLKLRQLAALSRTNAGYTSRVAELLQREELIQRSSRGQILDADWKGILRQLAQDYSLLDSNRNQFFIEPRGLSAFEKRLEASGFDYLPTGSLALEKINPTAPLKLATVYVPDIGEAAQQLGLREAPAGGNVVLLEPRDPLLFELPRWTIGELSLPGLSQAVLDAMTSPGRGPSEAEAMLSWMERNESMWRRNAAEST